MSKKHKQQQHEPSTVDRLKGLAKETGNKLWGFGYEAKGNNHIGGSGVGGGYQHHIHDAVKPVMIGGYAVHLGRRPDLTMQLVSRMDVICPLNGSMPPTQFGALVTTVSCELQDFGGVPKGFTKFIENIANQIVKGKAVLGYCTGGHGRTGTFGAALIAVMEPKVSDPIAEIRKRHCKKAVETIKQADAIFGMMADGGLAPQNYFDEFEKKYSFSSGFGQQSSFPASSGQPSGSKPSQSPVKWGKDPETGMYARLPDDAPPTKSSKVVPRSEVEGLTPLMTGSSEDGEWFFMPGKGMVRVEDVKDILDEDELDYMRCMHGVGY